MNVPEAKDYHVVYDLDLDKLSRDIQYDMDNHGTIRPSIRPHRLLSGASQADWKTRSISMSRWTLSPVTWPDWRADLQFRRAFPDKRGELGRSFQRERDCHRRRPGGGNIDSGRTTTGRPTAPTCPTPRGTFSISATSRPTPPTATAPCKCIITTRARRCLRSITGAKACARTSVLAIKPKDSADWTFAGSAGGFRAVSLSAFWCITAESSPW